MKLNMNHHNHCLKKVKRQNIYFETKEVYCLCKELSFTVGMLKSLISVGEKK